MYTLPNIHENRPVIHSRVEGDHVYIYAKDKGGATSRRWLRSIPVTICSKTLTRGAFADGRESRYFYRDDNAGRPSITGNLTSEEAMAKAKDFARTELSHSEGSPLRRP
jgi:hypothetical protein